MTSNWHDLYRAAIFESNPAKLPALINAAEEAIVNRGRQLLTVSRQQDEESDALDDALYGLRALRSSLQWRTHESRVA